MSRLRVLLVEDEPWIRRSVEQLLRGDERVAEVVAVERGHAALAQLGRTPPDVALVDLGLPDISGIDVITALRQRAPACTPVVFTVLDDAATILAALRAGARGYLLKSTPSAAILPALLDAHAGGLPLSPHVARHVVDTLLDGGPAADRPALTERETELLRLLARGATYAACAAELGISLGTVQGYVKSIYAKLDVSTKAEAAVAASRLGLV